MNMSCWRPRPCAFCRNRGWLPSGRSLRDQLDPGQRGTLALRTADLWFRSTRGPKKVYSLPPPGGRNENFDFAVGDGLAILIAFSVATATAQQYDL